jgi:hypothetical protein
MAKIEEQLTPEQIQELLKEVAMPSGFDKPPTIDPNKKGTFDKLIMMIEEGIGPKVLKRIKMLPLENRGAIARSPEYRQALNKAITNKDMLDADIAKLAKDVVKAIQAEYKHQVKVINSLPRKL